MTVSGMGYAPAFHPAQACAAETKAAIAAGLSKAIFTTIGSVLARPLVAWVESFGWLDPDTYSVMSKYTENLTQKAKDGKLHDATGRDSDIDSLITILTREGKGNAMVLGEAGVGKTALVEGLAYRIAHSDEPGNEKSIPEEFKNKKIIKVNMVSLIAGNAYNANNMNGAVNRIRALFEKAEKDPDIILFIDEFHQVASFAELCKTYLDRGTVHIIAATTVAEYNQYIARDPALERRFTKVTLKEPTQHETVEILKNLREDIQLKNHVSINDSALLSAVKLTGMYMKNRTYPDKAIDVVSSAAKSVSQKNSSSDIPGFVPKVTEEDIKVVISNETGTPLGKISNLEKDLLDSMEERVKRSVIGQEKAVKAACAAVRKSRVSPVSSSKPRSTMLFTGTSGVGKSALAERIGKEYNNLIKLDLSQSDLSTDFLEKVWKRPYSVVLFDNIDRTHEGNYNKLRGILENGYTYDQNKRKVDFTNSIIIMTANIGDDILLSNDSQNSKAKVVDKVESLLGSRFCGRLDKIVVFNKLSKESVKEILRISTDELESKLSSENINFKVEQDVIDNLSNIEINHKFGAHQFKKVVLEKLEEPLFEFIAKGSLNSGDSVTCSMVNNKITFNINK